MKVSFTLPRWRERAGVRVDIKDFPLTLILSPRGEEIASAYFHKSLPLAVMILDNKR
jgi:hypothetical protein